MKKIVGISGSLRRGSANTAILRTLAEQPPAGVQIEVLDIAAVPLFNEDLEGNLPRSVVDLRAAVETADGVIFASPEYNHGTSGVLKNLIDWLSRPSGKSVLLHKKTLLLSASPAFTGGVRSQAQLSYSLQGIGAIALDYPEIVIPRVQTKVEDGRLIDSDTLAFIQEAIKRF